MTAPLRIAIPPASRWPFFGLIAAALAATILGLPAIFHSVAWVYSYLGPWISGAGLIAGVIGTVLIGRQGGILKLVRRIAGASGDAADDADQKIELRLVLASDYILWRNSCERARSTDSQRRYARYIDVEELARRECFPPYVSLHFRSTDLLLTAVEEMCDAAEGLVPPQKTDIIITAGMLLIGWIVVLPLTLLFGDGLLRIMRRGYDVEFPTIPSCDPSGPDAYRTLESVGLLSGDIVTIEPSRPVPGLMGFWGDLVPQDVTKISLSSFFDSVITDQENSRSIDGWYAGTIPGKGCTPKPANCIGAAILYTEEDWDIACYIREYYAAIHFMTGLYLHLYVFEYAPPSWGKARADVANFWRVRLPAGLRDVWRSLTMTASKPYPNAAVYEIARQLNLLPDHVPCCVLFINWNEVFSNRIIVKLTRPLPDFFRQLSSDIAAICERAIREGVVDTHLSDLTIDNLRTRLPSRWQSSHATTGEQLYEIIDAKLLGPTNEERTMRRILFLAADPTNASRLRLGEELREIQEKLQLARLRDHFQLNQRMSVRPVDLSQALLDVQPSIVHFSGHGTSWGAMCFENQNGEIHPIEPDALAGLFAQFADTIDCVLLNACYSENQAIAIGRHIKYVIGMSQGIADKAAIAFAIGFYQGIGAGRSVKDAFKLGCIQGQLQGYHGDANPILIEWDAS